MQCELYQERWVKIDTGATASEIAVGKRIGAGVAGVANTTPNGIVGRLVVLFLENHLKQVDLDDKVIFLMLYV